MRVATRSSGSRFTLALVGIFGIVTFLPARDKSTEGIHTLPEIGLSGFLHDHLGVVGVEDHNIDLGGIGSDLWCGNKGAGDDRPEVRGYDESAVCWMITDRGPNGEDPRTFPVPEFTPFILKVKASGRAIEILESIPITGLNTTRNGVTGIPNLANTTQPPALNEPFYGCGGSPLLDVNPHGLDTEGLVRTRNGEFYVVEEYGPSLLRIGPDGRVVTRYFPQQLLPFLSPITGYGTDDPIPTIYGLKRKLNRGFEGIAITPSEKTLYLALQSPLRNPDNATGDSSRNTRILAFDIPSQKVVGEYVYRFQFTGPTRDDDEFDVPSLSGNTGRARPQDMKISALAMLDGHRMLVLERTDFKAKLFLVDIRKATNILGTVWDDVAQSPSLETLNADGALEARGIDPLPKEFVLTLDSTVPVHGMPIPQKIEGLAILDHRTVAIANDNDFGVGSFTVDGDSCTLDDSGRESQIIVIRLDEPIQK